MSQVSRQNRHPFRPEHPKSGALSEGKQAEIIIFPDDLPDEIPPLFVAPFFQGKKSLKVENLGGFSFGGQGFFEEIELLLTVAEAAPLQEREHLLRLESKDLTLAALSLAGISSTGAVTAASSAEARSKRKSESDEEKQKNN
jgi:hypothetical protein